MENELYLHDCYLREFQAVVKESIKEENAVVLDRTAFYPGGGGQPFDLGQIEFTGRTANLTSSRKDGNRIIHYLEGDLPEAGTRVKGIIDWKRRYQLMRTHTALHMLSGVIWRDYQAQVTGGNMEPLSGRLDFELEALNSDLIKEIEEKVNLEIKQEREVRIVILPREEALAIPDLIRTKVNLLPPDLSMIRTVEIVGLDLQADGGTHVVNTREVRLIKIVKYKSKGRINKRLQIELEP